MPLTEAISEVIELDSFDTSFAVRPDQEGAARRRLMTLLAEPADEDRRGQSEVLRVHNTAGEAFALKRLRPLPADAEPFVRKGREAALFEEYRCQLAVSHLRGFPAVLGYGVTTANEPVILMQWVDGPTLAAVERTLMPAPELRGRATAAVGISLLRSLVSTQNLEGTFVHRDISPRNVILRGTNIEIAEGLARGHVTAYLVDFGSSVYLRHDEATFTATEDIWRNSTPEYTPPEMLAPREKMVIGERRLPAIDVYALCSLLYELYAGTTPFGVSLHPDQSAYQIKLASNPARPQALRAEDEPLIDAIMSGIRTSQETRPSEAELLAALIAWEQSEGIMPEGAQETPSPALGTEGAHLRAEKEPGRIDTEAASAKGSGSAQPSDAGVQASGATAVFGSGNSATSGVQDAKTGAGVPGSARHSPSRRTFLKVAAGVAGLATLGGVAVTTSGFGLLRPRSFSDLGWDDLAELSAQIKIASDENAALEIARSNNLLTDEGALRDDLVKPLALADGTQVSAQLVDLYHDDLADGGGKAGLSFMFTAPIAQHNMADEPMSSGGWESCGLRAWLSSDLMGQLPADLSSRIATVTKITNNQGAATDTSCLSPTSEQLWLPSLAELGGTRGTSTFSDGYKYLADILSNEGTQYRLWKQKGVTSRSANVDLVRSMGGNACYWWIRTPSPDVSIDEGVTWFNRVGTNGDPFHFAGPATGDENETYVLPGFCL